VFSSALGDIAAMTVTTRDFGGLGYDNFRFVPGPPQRDARCIADDAVLIDPDGGLGSVLLDAGVESDPDGVYFNYRWSTDCPSAHFDSPYVATPAFSAASPSGCRVECAVSVLVDDGEETDVCTTNVTIAGDEPAGQVVCPSDMTLESDGEGNLAELEAWLAGATAGGATPTDDFDHLDYGCNATGAVTVTWEASPAMSTGGCGGGGSCSATFTIVDTTAPSISLDPSFMEVDNSDCLESVEVMLPNAVASDDSGGALVVANDAPDSFPAGQSTVVTYTATDACGNASTAALEVNVASGAGVRIKVRHGDHALGDVAGVTVRAFDVGRGSCARSLVDPDRGVSAHAYEAIIAQCEPVASRETGVDGTAAIGLFGGPFVVIGLQDRNEDGSPDVVGGVVTGKVRCGEWKEKRLQMDETGFGMNHHSSAPDR